MAHNKSVIKRSQNLSKYIKAIYSISSTYLLSEKQQRGKQILKLLRSLHEIYNGETKAGIFFRYRRDRNILNFIDFLREWKRFARCQLMDWKEMRFSTTFPFLNLKPICPFSSYLLKLSLDKWRRKDTHFSSNGKVFRMLFLPVHKYVGNRQVKRKLLLLWNASIVLKRRNFNIGRIALA